MSTPIEEPPPHEREGFAFQVWRSGVDRARQARYHAAAGVDGALHGDHVDASVLANDCLHGARPRDALGAIRLHAGVRVRQSAPVPLGAALDVHATVDALRPARRGRYIHIDFAFRLQDGTTPIRIDHRSLILDPEPPETSAKSTAPQPAQAFEPIRRVQLTPEMVSGYSYEFPHLEGHHDPEAAARIGMRAPIAQGLMGFTLLFAEAMRRRPATRFDVEANFQRPIFWDDELALEVSEDGRRLRALNPGGKPASELVIHAWDGAAG